MDYLEPNEFSSDDEKGFESEEEVEEKIPNCLTKNDFKSSNLKLCKQFSLNSFNKFDKESLKKRISFSDSSEKNFHQPLKRISSRNKHVVEQNQKCINVNMSTKNFVRFFFVL